MHINLNDTKKAQCTNLEAHKSKLLYLHVYHINELC